MLLSGFVEERRRLVELSPKVRLFVFQRFPRGSEVSAIGRKMWTNETGGVNDREDSRSTLRTMARLEYQ